MDRRELERELLYAEVPKKVISALPKILVASNRTFIESDGSRSDTFRGSNGIIVSDIGIKNPNGITLTGVNEEGLTDVLVQIKEPSHFESGKILHDPVYVKIALYTEDSSVIVTKAFPRTLTLFSPEVSVYSPQTVERFLLKYCNQVTDVFDIIFHKKIIPDVVTQLKCQRIGYRIPFEITKLMPLIKKGYKQKRIH